MVNQIKDDRDAPWPSCSFNENNIDIVSIVYGVSSLAFCIIPISAQIVFTALILIALRVKSRASYFWPIIALSGQIIRIWRLLPLIHF